jgi:hypothetical protein
MLFASHFDHLAHQYTAQYKADHVKHQPVYERRRVLDRMFEFRAKGLISGSREENILLKVLILVESYIVLQTMLFSQEKAFFLFRHIHM